MAQSLVHQPPLHIGTADEFARVRSELQGAGFDEETICRTLKITTNGSFVEPHDEQETTMTKKRPTKADKAAAKAITRKKLKDEFAKALDKLIEVAKNLRSKL